MSTALAIAGVSAVLQYYVGNAYTGLSSYFGGTPGVSAKAPDIVQTLLGTGSALQNQVNLFLHQVTENAAWRNVGQPWLAADGKTPLKNPPLALDLHYLLTAYGSNDWQAEALLGYALLMMHENPVMTRQDIRNAFTGLATNDASNPLSQYLASSGLADQIEMIKITPSTLGREEMAWLWTALKADYRPTFPFQVSVVLMQPSTSLSLSFPVLHRNIIVQASVPPQLLEIRLPHHQVSATPGQVVKVKGEYLSGASQVLLANPRLTIQQPVNATVIDNNTLSFTVPDTPLTFPAGIYSLSILFNDASGNTLQSTSSLPFAVAPVLQTAPPPQVTQSGIVTQVSIVFSPYAMASQTVSLTLGSSSATAGPIDALTNSAILEFSPALSSGSYLARLSVDGAPSLIEVNWLAAPPVFVGPMVTV